MEMNKCQMYVEQDGADGIWNLRLLCREPFYWRFVFRVRCNNISCYYLFYFFFFLLFWFVESSPNASEKVCAHPHFVQNGREKRNIKSLEPKMDTMCTNVKWMDAIARKMNTLRLSASKNAKTYCVPASAYIFSCGARSVQQCDWREVFCVRRRRMLRFSCSAMWCISMRCAMCTFILGHDLWVSFSISSDGISF